MPASLKNQQCSYPVILSLKIGIDPFKESSKIGNVPLWDKLDSPRIFNNLHFLPGAKMQCFPHLAGNNDLELW